MARKTTLIIMLFICILLHQASAESSEGGRRPVLGFGIIGGLAVADNPLGGSPEFFTTKAQAVGALDMLIDIPMFSVLYLGIGFQLHTTTISNYAGGWVYRSHWGGGLRLSTSYRFNLTEPSKPLQLTLGLGAGASFNVDLYTFTTLFFFYPGIFLQPYLELDHSRNKKSSLALVLPIEYYFRRDLGFYGCLGVGVVWRYTRSKYD